MGWGLTRVNSLGSRNGRLPIAFAPLLTESQTDKGANAATPGDLLE